MKQQKRTPKAFTLIELLVVVVIIALLLSIIVPSLSRAKRQAQSVYCQNNLRQMLVAAVVYTENNRGFFPIGYYTRSTGDAMIHYNWDFTIYYPVSSSMPTTAGFSVVPTEQPQPEGPKVAPGILWQTDVIAKIQQCPSFRGSSNTANDPYTGYNYNTSYIGRGEGEDIPQPVRRDFIKRLSGTAVFGDGQSTNGGANKFMRAPLRSEGDLSFNDRYAGAQGFRHDRRTNIAWADGSASTQDEVYTTIEPARYKKNLDDYNRQNPRSPVGFLSSDNSAYKTR